MRRVCTGERNRADARRHSHDLEHKLVRSLTWAVTRLSLVPCGVCSSAVYIARVCQQAAVHLCSLWLRWSALAVTRARKHERNYAASHAPVSNLIMNGDAKSAAGSPGSWCFSSPFLCFATQWGAACRQSVTSTRCDLVLRQLKISMSRDAVIRGVKIMAFQPLAAAAVPHPMPVVAAAAVQ